MYRVFRYLDPSRVPCEGFINLEPDTRRNKGRESVSLNVQQPFK